MLWLLQAASLTGGCARIGFAPPGRPLTAVSALCYTSNIDLPSQHTCRVADTGGSI